MADGDEPESPDPLERQIGKPAVVRDVFEAMPVLMVAMEGPEHRMAAANAVYRAFADRSGFIGRTAREVFPELAGQQLFPLLDRVYRSGEAVNAREWRIQVEPSEGNPTGEFYADFTVAPWPAADGSVRGLLVTQSDVTERVRQRQAVEYQVAVAERRYEAAHEIVTALQEALLPTSLPVLPGIRVAARYVVAAEELAAGGDWFDALPLADGTLALLVGDMVGHGVAASASMGRLRAVIEHSMLADSDLAKVLADVDAYASRSPALRSATRAVVVVDPASGDLRYATCGHPPPLVVAPDGAARFLPHTGGGPLGTGTPPVLAPASLAAGEVVVLYSDGLVERPGRNLEDGLVELAQVAGDAAANRIMPTGAEPSAAERISRLTVELLTRTGHNDDVTVLTAERLAAPPPDLDLGAAADSPSLRELRRGFDGWLDDLDPSDEDRDALQLAVWELISNAVEHAYVSGEPGPVRLQARLGADGTVECRVGDHGTWRVPELGAVQRGRGLLMAEQLTDWMQVTHPDDDAGTVVVLRRRVFRPAVLAINPGGHARVERSGVDFAVAIDTTGDAPLARVRGPVDITTSDDLARDLFRACRGGTVALVVDLSEVSHLASAGVRVLHELRERLGAHDRKLTLVAPAASPAHLVLELVQLAHRDR